jgi:multidrug efflux pump subunit AcrB
MRPYARFLPELRERYPDIEVTLEGQAKESTATGGSMLRGFVPGLLGIFLLLAFQFRSFSEPLAVMAAIPLALFGFSPAAPHLEDVVERP